MINRIVVLIVALVFALPGNSCGKENVSDKTKNVNGVEKESAVQKGSADDRPVPEGKWGGHHVRLDVSESGAKFEFDCAHGRLSGPLKLQDGRFTATGTFVRERGRVTLEDSERGQPVYFKGVVEGSRMTLTFSPMYCSEASSVASAWRVDSSVMG